MSLLPAPALALFERQHSVAARRQLLDWVASGELAGLVRHGHLRRVQRAVYRPAGATLTREGVALAAVLRCSEGSRLTGPFVLGLLGVDGFGLEDPFEVLVPRGRRPTNVPFPIREDPEPDTLTPKRGELALAPFGRCLIDSARPAFRIDTGRLLTGYDSARWRNLTSTDRFRDDLSNASPRDKGARRWRRLGLRGILIPEGRKERLLMDWMSVFDPPPEPQVWVTPRRRVDFLWRLIRLALEYQGRGAHGHQAGRERDLVREEELDRVGTVVLPIVAEDLADRDRFLDWVERIAVARARELGVPAPTRKLREVRAPAQ